MIRRIQISKMIQYEAHKKSSGDQSHATVTMGNTVTTVCSNVSDAVRETVSTAVNSLTTPAPTTPPEPPAVATVEATGTVNATDTSLVIPAPTTPPGPPAVATAPVVVATAPIVVRRRRALPAAEDTIVRYKASKSDDQPTTFATPQALFDYNRDRLQHIGDPHCINHITTTVKGGKATKCTCQKKLFLDGTFEERKDAMEKLLKIMEAIHNAPATSETFVTFCALTDVVIPEEAKNVAKFVIRGHRRVAQEICFHALLQFGPPNYAASARYFYDMFVMPDDERTKWHKKENKGPVLALTPLTKYDKDFCNTMMRHKILATHISYMKGSGLNRMELLARDNGAATSNTRLHQVLRHQGMLTVGVIKKRNQMVTPFLKKELFGDRYVIADASLFRVTPPGTNQREKEHEQKIEGLMEDLLANKQSHEIYDTKVNHYANMYVCDATVRNDTEFQRLVQQQFVTDFGIDGGIETTERELQHQYGTPSVVYYSTDINSTNGLQDFFRGTMPPEAQEFWDTVLVPAVNKVDGWTCTESTKFSMRVVMNASHSTVRAIEKIHTVAPGKTLMDLEEKKQALLVCLVPLEEDGITFRYWPKFREEAEGEAPATLTHGKLANVTLGSLVIFPATLLHAGGYRTSPTGNKYAEFLITVQKKSNVPPNIRFDTRGRGYAANANGRLSRDEYMNLTEEELNDLAQTQSEAEAPMPVQYDETTFKREYLPFFQNANTGDTDDNPTPNKRARTEYSPSFIKYSHLYKPEDQFNEHLDRTWFDDMIQYFLDYYTV